MSQAKTTTDHDETRRWAEERGGGPSHVNQSGRNGLAPRQQDKAVYGKPDRCNRLVSRED